MIYQFLSATLTEKSRIRLTSSGENQASIRAFVCSGAVFAVPLLDIIEDRMICVIFGSSLIYTALLFPCTLGLPNAIAGVALIVGTSYSIEDDAFAFVGIGVGVGAGVGVGVGVGVDCLFLNPIIKSLAFCASITHLVLLSAAKSRIAVISSGENQASARAFVCSGAVFA